MLCTLPVSYLGDPSRRSIDGGHNWVKLARLEAGHEGLNYQYPTIAQNGNQLLVVYSITRTGTVDQVGPRTEARDVQLSARQRDLVLVPRGTSCWYPGRAGRVACVVLKRLGEWCR
mmetsp:Transcript_69500/g.220001  ORF Transcript_69500/g.220001 Transcript_69500/m.220001 type:complete len:116 (-) Transcript_69500:406-753(-)